MKRLLVTIAAGIFAMGLSTTAFADAANDYKAKCSSCHGQDGKGQTKMGKKLNIKDLTAAAVQDALTDESIIKQITDGVKDEKTGKDRMPALGKKLSAEQIKALVPIVRAFKGK